MSIDAERSPWRSLVTAAVAVHLGAAAIAGLASLAGDRAAEPRAGPSLPRVALAWLVSPPSPPDEVAPDEPPCAGASCRTVEGPEPVEWPAEALRGPAVDGAEPVQPAAIPVADSPVGAPTPRSPRAPAPRAAVVPLPAAEEPRAGPELPIADEGDQPIAVPTGAGDEGEGGVGQAAQPGTDPGEVDVAIRTIALPGSPLVVTLGTRDPRYADYLGSLYRLLEPEWRDAFPRERALYMQQGEIVLEWTVAADGSIGDVRVLRPSGVAPFDRNVVAGFRRAAPRFPRPPRDMPLPVTIRAPYRYRNPMFE
jgi:protein TonB